MGNSIHISFVDCLYIVVWYRLSIMLQNYVNSLCWHKLLYLHFGLHLLISLLNLFLSLRGKRFSLVKRSIVDSVLLKTVMYINLKDLFEKPFCNFRKVFLRFIYCRPAIFLL